MKMIVLLFISVGAGAQPAGPGMHFPRCTADVVHTKYSSANT